MYCPNCGAMMRAGFDTCQYCGTKVICQQAPTQEYQANNQPNQGYGMPQNNYQPNYQSGYNPNAYNPYYPQRPPRPKYNLQFSIMSMVFAIVALYFGIFAFFPLFGIIAFMPIFIVFTSLSRKYARKHRVLGYPLNGFYKAGRIVSTVAIPIGAVFSFFGFLMTIVMFE